MAYENIPVEMRAFPQWVGWRYEDRDAPKPTKVPYSVDGFMAKVNDPLTWATFGEVLLKAKAGIFDGIGFVLTEQDPFAFIDLDDTKGDAELIAKQMEIYNEFVSYAERSPSGKGLHIIIKGSIPSGRKRSSIEIYSNLRFMTMTGDVFRNEAITDCNVALNMLYERMSQGKNVDLAFGSLEACKHTNEEILQVAMSAQNAEKFNDLYYLGNWQKYYPSQSEADFALVDILAFYSENRWQVQDMFLSSALGQREKSRAQYRINYMLDRCFDRMLPPVDIEGFRNQVQELIDSELRKQAMEEGLQKIAAMPAIEAEPDQPPPFSFVKPMDTPFQPEEDEESDMKPRNSLYTVPPGLLGEIAQFIYAQAPRPVPEIALVGAIGLMAGIVGRSYNVSGVGLNKYILLLAPTGTGKEAIASGIDKLMSQVVVAVPAAFEFIGPGKINSEPALLKYMSKVSNSFVSVVGEFGIELGIMSSPFAPAHQQGLLRMFLDLFNKTGEGKILKPSIYSDSGKSTLSVISPALTLVGESTPEKFYEKLDESMISSGLLPRFSIIEYNGPRPPLNEESQFAKPSFELIEKMTNLCSYSLMLNSQNKVVNLKSNYVADKLFKDFDVYCDLKINKTTSEINKHLWNRAHIKALKLASLIAVGCNQYEPIINEEMASWAINLTIADANNMIKRFESGQVGFGSDEQKQLAMCMQYIKDFICSPWKDVAKYVGDTFKTMHKDAIVPYSYLQRRLASNVAFKKDRAGPTNALKRVIKTMQDRGDIQEVNRATLSKTYGTTSAAYAISNSKAFEKLG